MLAASRLAQSEVVSSPIPNREEEIIGNTFLDDIVEIGEELGVIEETIGADLLGELVEVGVVETLNVDLLAERVQVLKAPAGT